MVLVRSRGAGQGSRVRVAGALDRFEEGETLIVAGTLEGLDMLERPN